MLVVEPIAKRILDGLGIVEVEANIESWAYGLVEPMPTKPELFTRKLMAVDEPTTNWLDAYDPFGLTENVAQGEVVPTPTKPELLMRKLVPVEEPTTNWLEA